MILFSVKYIGKGPRIIEGAFNINLKPGQVFSAPEKLAKDLHRGDHSGFKKGDAPLFEITPPGYSDPWPVRVQYPWIEPDPEPEPEPVQPSDDDDDDDPGNGDGDDIDDDIA